MASAGKGVRTNSRPEVRLCHQRPRNRRARFHHRPRKRLSKPSHLPTNSGSACKHGENITEPDRRTPSHALLPPVRKVAALLPGDRHQPRDAGHSAGQEARSPDAGHGTGKTVVAFQICWKLWNTRWNRTGDPRAARESSISPTATSSWTTPRTRSSRPSATPGTRSRARPIKSREMYFATYQAIAKDERRPGLYREYPRDFFDLIIVDECHRGSASGREQLARDILNISSRPFSSA